MKTIAITICPMLACTANAVAQSEWEIPESALQNNAPSKKKKEKKAADGAADNTSSPKMKIDRKYAAGTVPLVEGKVEWTKDIDVAGC